MDFSIIIPAKNASLFIADCLYSVKNQNYHSQRFEIIVVNDNSSDNTEFLAKKVADKVITNKFSSVGAVRNRGVQESHGKIIAFLDSDMLVDKCWLEKAAEYFFNYHFDGMISFADEAPESAGWVGKIWNSPKRNGNDRVHKVDTIPSRNMLLPRSLHEKIGGFDEKLFAGGKAGEDKEYSYSITQHGYSILSIPGLQMFHLGYEKGLLEFCKKEFWRQGNMLLIAKKYKYKPRLLKNPLLAFYHILTFLVCFIVIFIPVKFFLISSVVLALAPSFLITFKKLSNKKNIKFFMQLWFLTWLRWLIAGFTVFPQVYKLGKNYFVKKD